MEWKEEYAIGIPQIDTQHKGLFRAVTRISNIIDEDDHMRDQRACEEALRFLKSYTLTHFEEEEAFMLSFDYPDYAAHKRLHDAFRDTILSNEQKLLNASLSRQAVLEFVDLLTNWLINHILYQDQMIAKAFHSK